MKRLLCDLMHPLDEKVLRDFGMVVPMQGVRDDIRPYVNGDWRITYSLEEAEEWLAHNKKGRAILLSNACGQTARMFVARTVLAALRILKREA